MKKWQKLEYELRKDIEQELYVLNIKGNDTEYVRGLIDAYNIVKIFLDNKRKNLMEEENE